MNHLIKRLEKLFMAVSFAEAHYMNLFTLCVNDSLFENAFFEKQSPENPQYKSTKSLSIRRNTEMHQPHS